LDSFLQALSGGSKFGRAGGILLEILLAGR